MRTRLDATRETGAIGATNAARRGVRAERQGVISARAEALG